MWKQKLVLDEGETLRFESRREKGHLGQEEVELYSVLNVNGHVIGEVQYIDHTSTKAPFRKSFHLIQRKGDKTLLDERWEN
jgi:hypothetical protein